VTALALLCAATFAIALLYSSVGQAGASGYIALLMLFGFGPSVVKPTVLVLNILVASIGAYQFWRAGHFSWQLFWPFSALSIPFAFVGGFLFVPTNIFRLLVGAVLLVSAVRLFLERKEARLINVPPLSVSLPVGAGIGLLSGITATGGGIFLTPLLLFFRWANMKAAAATSASAGRKTFALNRNFHPA
jgi:uncharacterized membrane protein YfcA